MSDSCATPWSRLRKRLLISHHQRGRSRWKSWRNAARLQAPLSMGCFRQEYWSGLPFPSPGDLPDPEINPESLAPPALASRFFTTSNTWEAQIHIISQSQFLHSSFDCIIPPNKNRWSQWTERRDKTVTCMSFWAIE